MTASKLVILSIFLSLVLTHVRASPVFNLYAEPELELLRPGRSADSFAGKKETEQQSQPKLKAKRDETEKTIQQMSEMSVSIASMLSEIASLQKNGTLVAELVHKAQARIDELEQQAENRNSELETQNKEKAALVTRIDEAERKVHELSLELETKYGTLFAELVRKAQARIDELEKQADKLNSELETQNKEKAALVTRIDESERKVHELSLELETKNGTLVAELVRKAHARIDELQQQAENRNSELETQNKEKAALVTRIDEAERKVHELETALEKKAQAKKWAAASMETIKTKWISTIKEQWVVLKTNTEPHVQTLGKKIIEVYGASRTKVTPHLVQVQKFIDTYFQEARKFSKPYIDLIADVAKPHVEKVRAAIKPYTKEVGYVYGEFLKSATTYHHQMQATVQEMLKRHELTRPLATKELVWFAASALLALPIIILFRIGSTIFYKKAKKPTQNAHTNHAHRKAKRGHPDK